MKICIIKDDPKDPFEGRITCIVGTGQKVTIRLAESKGEESAIFIDPSTIPGNECQGDGMVIPHGYNQIILYP
jgi:hypothetical protein